MTRLTMMSFAAVMALSLTAFAQTELDAAARDFAEQDIASNPNLCETLKDADLSAKEQERTEAAQLIVSADRAKNEANQSGSDEDRFNAAAFAEYASDKYLAIATEIEQIKICKSK